MWAEFSLEPSCVFRSVGALVEGPYWPQMELFCWSAAFSGRRKKRDLELNLNFRNTWQNFVLVDT